jgi:hypothetical protein
MTMTLGRNGKRVTKTKFRLDQRVQVSFQGTTTGTTILHKGTITKIHTYHIRRKYDILFDDKEKHTIEESRIRPAQRGSGKARKHETAKPSKRRKSADRESDGCSSTSAAALKKPKVSKNLKSCAPHELETEAAVVCAIDFGTARTGYAYAFTNKPGLY